MTNPTRREFLKTLTLVPFAGLAALPVAEATPALGVLPGAPHPAWAGIDMAVGSSSTIAYIAYWKDGIRHTLHPKHQWNDGEFYMLELLPEEKAELEAAGRYQTGITVNRDAQPLSKYDVTIVEAIIPPSPC